MTLNNLLEPLKIDINIIYIGFKGKNQQKEQGSSSTLLKHLLPVCNAVITIFSTITVMLKQTQHIKLGKFLSKPPHNITTGSPYNQPLPEA